MAVFQTNVQNLSHRSGRHQRAWSYRGENNRSSEL